MKLSRMIAVLAHPTTLSAGAAVTMAVVRAPALTRRLLVAMPLSIATCKALKHAFPRHKPRLLSLTPDQSFPSGHASATTALAVSLVDAFGAWRAAPLAVGAIALVGACRVDAREHRVSEVLVGTAVGLGAAVTAGLVARAIAARRERAAARTTSRATDVA